MDLLLITEYTENMKRKRLHPTIARVEQKNVLTILSLV